MGECMLAFTRKPQSAALAFLVTGACFFVVGTSYGLFTAIHLVAPEFFNNIGWLVFGRTRPAHVNTVIYGFVTMTLVGCALYYVPALLRRKLWSEPLGWFSWALWTIVVLSGPVTFSLGHSQGREYAEYLWIFDVMLTVSVLGLVVNVVMTIVNRREKILYVSVWYVAGAVLWTAGVYPIGNVLWRPWSGAVPGLMDSIVLWYYGHNLVGLLLTPFAVATAYFVVPRIAQRPLYSHTLSLVGFWMLVAIYSHIGGHHILQAPIPNWLKVISVIDSLAMFIPVFTVLGNIWLTARGSGGNLLRSPAGRFVIAGTIWYLIVGLQGPLHSLQTVQKITHFNNWVIGHAHIAVLGFAGFIAIGGLWHVLPYVAKRRIYSERLINLQFGLATLGLVGFFIVLTAAGLVQGSSWYNGETVYRVLPMLPPYMAMRGFLGLFIIASAVVGLANLILTLRRGERFEPAAEEGVAPL